MECEMTHDEHALRLGMVVANFQTLEHLIRLFLCEANNQKIIFPTAGDFPIKCTYETNDYPLNKLIDDYNTSVGSEFAVDKMVIDIRDAIAHGRISSRSKSFPIRLMKPSRHGKDAEMVDELVFDELLTVEWFERTLSNIRDQISKVSLCAESRGYFKGICND